MSDAFETPGEAVIGLLLWRLSHSERIRAAVEANDRDHFVEGGRSPWFRQEVGMALVELREAISGGGG